MKYTLLGLITTAKWVVMLCGIIGMVIGFFVFLDAYPRSAVQQCVMYANIITWYVCPYCMYRMLLFFRDSIDEL